MCSGPGGLYPTGQQCELVPTLGLVLRCRTSSSCLRKPSSCDRPILRKREGDTRVTGGTMWGRTRGPMIPSPHHRRLRVWRGPGVPRRLRWGQASRGHTGGDSPGDQVLAQNHGRHELFGVLHGVLTAREVQGFRGLWAAPAGRLSWAGWGSRPPSSTHLGDGQGEPPTGPSGMLWGVSIVGLALVVSATPFWGAGVTLLPQD